MATIYRFVIEQKQSGSSGQGRTPRDNTTRKSSAKSGRSISLFGGDKGGVEHNRKMRAINPLMNRITGGWWEKGFRVGRAGIGLGKSINKNGAKGIFSGPALYIIAAFAITMLIKWHQKQIQNANQQNAQNYKQLENGVGAIHGQYKVSQNFWNGRITYNQNK